MGQVLSVAVAIGMPLAAGTAIGTSLQNDVKGWYSTLKKPSWNPPNWVFGPVWTALYTAMGYASYLVWKNGGGAVPLTLYGIQLLLNLAWSPLFFKQHDIGFALLDVSALLGVLTATIVKFYQVSPPAAYLLMPYFGWTAFAAALTLDVYQRNPDKRGKQSKKVRESVESGLQQAESSAIHASKRIASEAQKGVDKLGATGGSTSDPIQEKTGQVRAS